MIQTSDHLRGPQESRHVDCPGRHYVRPVGATESGPGTRFCEHADHGSCAGTVKLPLLLGRRTQRTVGNPALRTETNGLLQGLHLRVGRCTASALNARPENASAGSTISANGGNPVMLDQEHRLRNLYCPTQDDLLPESGSTRHQRRVSGRKRGDKQGLACH